MAGTRFRVIIVISQVLHIWCLALPVRLVQLRTNALPFSSTPLSEQRLSRVLALDLCVEGNNNNGGTTIKGRKNGLWSNFRSGGKLAIDNSVWVILNAARCFIPLGVLATGFVPAAAYYGLSPCAGVAVSKGIAKTLISLYSVDEGLLRPIVKVVHLLMAVPLVGMIGLHIYLMAQFLVIKDVEKGEPTLGTFMVDMLKRRRAKLAPAKPAFVAESGRVPVANVFQQAIKSTESWNYMEHIPLFEPYLLGPIREELVFRSVLQSGFKWIEQFIVHKHSCRHDVAYDQDSHSPFLLFGYPPSILLSSMLFGLVHISNWNDPLQVVASGVCSDGDEMNFIRSAFTFIMFPVAQCSISFLCSLRILSKAYESYGIIGSIGAHMTWNLLTPFLIMRCFVLCFCLGCRRLKCLLETKICIRKPKNS